MPQKITFGLKTRPSAKSVGRTDVINTITDKEGAVVSTETIGKIQKTRGVDALVASVMNADGSRTQLDGTFTSRSQAGHAVQRAFYAEAKAEKAAAKAAEKAANAKAVAARKAARAKAKADKAAA